MYNITRRARSMRAAAVISATLVLLGGVTFAALQSQNVISSGNRISSATASLQIGDAQGNFSGTMPGFNFTNVEPGGAPSPASGNIVRLRNDGTAALQLQMTVNRSTLINVNSANTDRVFVDITPVAGGPTSQLSLSQLMSAYLTATPIPLNTTLASGQTGLYNVQIEIATDAIPAGSTSVAFTNVDFIFSGKFASS